MDPNDFLRFIQGMTRSKDDEKYTKKRVLTQDEEKLWLEYKKIITLSDNLENQAKSLSRKFWAEMELTEKNYCNMKIVKEKDQYFLFIDEENDA